MRKIISSVLAIIVTVIGITMPSGVEAQNMFEFKDVITDELMIEISQGEKVQFEKWNQINISVSEKEINEILIDKFFSGYLDSHPEILPDNMYYRSAKFNINKRTLNISMRLGKFRIGCDLSIVLDTESDDYISFGDPDIRIIGIRLPKFITRVITKDILPYKMSYEQMNDVGSFAKLEKINLTEGNCVICMSISEEMFVNSLKNFIPGSRIELLKDKRISDTVDLSSLKDIKFYINEETVNRIFNEQLQKYIESGDTVIQEGLSISDVKILLKDKLIGALLSYMGYPIEVQAEFEIFCLDNIVGIDMGEMYLEGRQLPSVIKNILTDFTKEIRFDLIKAGIPSFISVKNIYIENSEIVINISLDMLNREPLKIEQLEFLLGPGVKDENEYFEYFVPISDLNESVAEYINASLIQSGINSLINRSDITEDLKFLINEDSPIISDFSLDMIGRTIKIVFMIWNIPIEIQAEFSLDSSESTVILLVYNPVIKPADQQIPESVMSRIIGERLEFSADYNDVSRFFLVEELILHKFCLEQDGLIIRFSIK